MGDRSDILSDFDLSPEEPPVAQPEGQPAQPPVEPPVAQPEGQPAQPPEEQPAPPPEEQPAPRSEEPEMGSYGWFLRNVYLPEHWPGGTNNLTAAGTWAQETAATKVEDSLARGEYERDPAYAWYRLRKLTEANQRSSVVKAPQSIVPASSDEADEARLQAESL